MKILTNYLKLSREDQHLLIKTFISMITIRLKLYLIPFNQLQKSIEKSNHKSANNIPLPKLISAVESVSYYVPQATCLTKALTAKKLLTKYGYPSQIKIGVNKSNKGEFEAHAWLEYAGKVIIGESEQEYTLITDL